MRLDLTDTSVIVTGASRGIGRASAIALAQAGAHVVAVARTQGALEELDDVQVVFSNEEIDEAIASSQG